MRFGNWFGNRKVGNDSRHIRMQRAASRERQRILSRPWMFELLEDRALLAGLLGLHNIGPTGDFTSITAAIASIQTNGLDGALTLELQSSYVSTVETFPLVFSNLGTSVVNTITLRPEFGVTNLTISSADTTTATVDLNGSQYVTIDGRSGGIGATKALTIENTDTSGIALRFINEARNNTIAYVALRGVNTSATSGVVVFGATTGPNGNDNNSILHSDIRDGVSTPANGVYSSSTDTGARANSDNTIANSNIYNFYSSTSDSAGVFISSGNGAWTIANNSFFQTSSRLAVAYHVRPIFVTSGFASITENAIGGSEPNAGGAPWTTTYAEAANPFVGIALGTPSGISADGSIQGNAIRNIDWTGSWINLPEASVWIGIYARSGNVNIGGVAGNTIGSETGTGAIRVTSSQSGGTVYGIYASGTSGTKVISNNKIGSITAYGVSDEISTSIIGILVTSGTTASSTVSNNLIGSLSTPNSLNASSLSMQTSFNQIVRGIRCTGGASITGNTIANLYNNAVVGGRGWLWGIETTSGVNNIVGNTVRNLSTPSNGGGQTGTVIGIYQSSKTAGQNISNNAVHTLLTSTTTSNAWVTGIFFDGQDTLSAVGPNYVQNNLVHSLAHASTGTSTLIGLRLRGVVVASNNIVRVGLDENGVSTANGSFIAGISVGSPNGQISLYHNSVFIGGTHTSGSAETYAFNHSAAISSGTGTSESRNNIFVNARSTVSGTSKHYAINRSATSNNNVYFFSGTGGAIGRTGSTDITTLADWQALTGQDAASIFADPRFVNPTGDANNVDLHLQNGSPSINAGAPIVGVTTDFDGELRSATAPNIGADETDELVPTVTGVFAAGSTWSAAIVDAVDGGGMGAGNGLGYAIGSGLTFPNAGIDRIYVQFSEPVVGFNAATVALLGVDVADYASVAGLMSVSYDSANRRGVIQLPSGLVKDKLRLGVSDAVKDLSLNALDGDANASAGGVMDLRFNVLVGDANNDGSVNGGDLPFFAAAFNTSTGNTSFNPRADWNANGSVNGGDLPLFAARFNQSLPTAEPAALGFPPAMLPSLDSDSMLAPPIEEIEAFFSELDEEDELLAFENSDETL